MEKDPTSKSDVINEPQEPELVNHPKHYNNYNIEVIDMMERIWGLAATAIYCQMNAFKYRMRMGTKPGESMARDLEKEQWYLNKANELKTKLAAQQANNK